MAELQHRGKWSDDTDGTAGCGHAHEVLPGVGRAGVVVEQGVEPGQPQHDADGVEQDEDPTDRRGRQQGDVHDEGRGDAEVHRVSQRVDLGTHRGLGVQGAGDAAVDAVKYRRGADQGQRDMCAAVQGELD